MKKRIAEFILATSPVISLFFVLKCREITNVVGYSCRPSFRGNSYLKSKLSHNNVLERNMKSTFQIQEGSIQDRNIAIVGGGLAGLSVAYHLLSKAHSNWRDNGSSLKITIFDKTPSPGLDGASAIAGGLLHPLSPRGKLVHLGFEGLESTNKLISAAVSATSNDKGIVLRNCLYRLAMTEKNVCDLQETSALYPNIAKWISSDELTNVVGSESGVDNLQFGSPVLGGLKLEGGCKVIHVPSYLRGLWKACGRFSLQNENSNLLSIKWTKEHLSCKETVAKGKTNYSGSLQHHLKKYDTVVLTAGAGLWHDSILKKADFPIELVRGQSIRTEFEKNCDDGYDILTEAILCGKYIIPTPCSSSHMSSMIIGATHEYGEEKLSQKDVINQLRNKSYNLHPRLWDEGSVTSVQTGWRVQTNRSNLGRIPITGRISTAHIEHDNVWIFSGLSSRGLLYHGIYGDMLSEALLMNGNRTCDGQ